MSNFKDFRINLAFSVISALVTEVIDRIKNPPQTPTPQPTPPAPRQPVPTVPAPQGPVITPKPVPDKTPSNETIMAFAQRDPDLQQLLGKYSHVLNKHYANPINSPHNMQGQQFTRELEGLIKRKFKA
jgi:hypothetical protein